MLIEIVYSDSDAESLIGSEEPFEPCTDNLKDLFKSLQKEHGRCTSKMYIDLPNGKVKHIGYCFKKKIKYDDFKEYFNRIAWITYLEEEDTVIRTKHYFNFN